MELFEMELFMNMDSASNNLQRLICHKTQTNKQSLYVHIYTFCVGFCLEFFLHGPIVYE